MIETLTLSLLYGFTIFFNNKFYISIFCMCLFFSFLSFLLLQVCLKIRYNIVKASPSLAHQWNQQKKGEKMCLNKILVSSQFQTCMDLEMFITQLLLFCENKIIEESITTCIFEIKDKQPVPKCRIVCRAFPVIFVTIWYSLASVLSWTVHSYFTTDLQFTEKTLFLVLMMQHLCDYEASISKDLDCWSHVTLSYISWQQNV